MLTAVVAADSVDRNANALLKRQSYLSKTTLQVNITCPEAEHCAAMRFTESGAMTPAKHCDLRGMRGGCSHNNLKRK